MECVNVEHEEVVLIPRWVQCERVTFKYGLGQEFIDVLRTLHKLGLDSTELVSVRGKQVAPRDVVAATLPDPATLGERMTGRTCAGTWVTGIGTDGAPRSTYLYHIVDNEHTMREYGSRRSCGRPRSTRSWRSSCLTRDCGRVRACLAPRPSRPSRSWSAWPSWGHPTGRSRCRFPAVFERARLSL